MKKALITGITGQDGALLAELLISNGYQVHGIRRRSSSFNAERIKHLLENENEVKNRNLILHYGDVTDATNLIRLIKDICPDEIYNLAAQSHVAVSFETPEYTAQSDALGALRLLEAIRILGLQKKIRFYQASTSELFGNGEIFPQNEDTPFRPCSPYAVAKLYAYWITVNYRESYGIFACNGILFNHESPIRGETFVTRKITLAVARILNGLQDTVYLGNLNARRDWGYAKDYVRAMWLMLQQIEPYDLVIATGKTHSVREFAQCAFSYAGIDLIWKGTGIDEVGIDAKTGKVFVRVNPRYFRPSEVHLLVGDARKARTILDWEPSIDFYELVKLMVKEDIELVNRQLQKNNLTKTFCNFEKTTFNEKIKKKYEL